ncbi:MAG: hypothetical protein U0694_20695 [Anaerolineae bacterium]
MAENLVGRTIDYFRIERLLGHGGLGSVYEARNLRSERKVVLKVIHPHLSAEEDFRKEFLQAQRKPTFLDYSRRNPVRDLKAITLYPAESTGAVRRGKDAP